MELTRSLVEAKAGEYADEEPLYAVEQENVEMLPDALERGDYGWRDAEWVVQWYFRRHLGAYDDAERRDAEETYGNNDFGAVRDAISATFDADDTEQRLDALTDLVGVDVPLASAFLQFMFPSRYVVVGEREWGVLRDAGELADPYPDDPGVDAYLAYHGACQNLCDRLDVDAWTLYRALWRLAKE